MQTSFTYVCVVNAAYLSQAVAMARSMMRHMPRARLQVYLAERKGLDISRLPENCELRWIEDLEYDAVPGMSFHYDPMSLCCALKPSVMRDAMNRTGAQAAVYLDSDLFFYGDPEPVLAETLAGHSVLLSPHVSDPSTAVNPINLMQVGSYNGGLVVVAGDERGNQFLDWWQGRLERQCVRDVSGGLFFDQHWLDLAAAAWDFVGAVRHPGVNVAHWNLMQRGLVSGSTGVKVHAGEPLLIFHFSGAERGRISKYMDHSVHDSETVRVALELASGYLDEVELTEQDFPVQAPYSYASFTTGELITREMREVLRLGLVASDDPFGDYVGIEGYAREREESIREENVSYRADTQPEAKRAAAEWQRTAYELANKFENPERLPSLCRFLRRLCWPNRQES